MSAALNLPTPTVLPVLTSSSFTVDSCRSHPDRVFVFGDNLIARGTAGQALIRHEPNAFGVPTKRLPSIGVDAYFSDQPEEFEVVEAKLRELFRLGRTRTLVFPKAGLGTGLAQMEQHSPKLWARMCDILLDHFQFSNGRSIRRDI